MRGSRRRGGAAPASSHTARIADAYKGIRQGRTAENRQGSRRRLRCHDAWIPQTAQSAAAAAERRGDAGGLRDSIGVLACVCMATL